MDNNTYINDYLMKNHELLTDEPIFDTTYNNIQTGGSDITNKPTGGFPPIVLCKSNIGKSIRSENKKRREYKPLKSSVSIKNIISSKKEVEPFL